MDIDMPDPPADQLDWQPALSWLPTLSAPDFVPGWYAGGEQTGPRHYNARYAVLAPEAEAFVRCLYDTHIVTGADWPAWMDHEGRALYDDPDRLTEASLEQCRMLLIAHVRGDRFTEGHLLSVLRDGHLIAVLERIRQLTVPPP